MKEADSILPSPGLCNYQNIKEFRLASKQVKKSATKKCRFCRTKHVLSYTYLVCILMELLPPLVE